MIVSGKVRMTRIGRTMALIKLRTAPAMNASRTELTVITPRKYATARMARELAIQVRTMPINQLYTAFEPLFLNPLFCNYNNGARTERGRCVAACRTLDEPGQRV